MLRCPGLHRKGRSEALLGPIWGSSGDMTRSGRVCRDPKRQGSALVSPFAGSAKLDPVDKAMTHDGRSKRGSVDVTSARSELGDVVLVAHLCRVVVGCHFRSGPEIVTTRLRTRQRAYFRHKSL